MEKREQMRVPSCFDCRHALVLRGHPDSRWGPPEQDVTECGHKPKPAEADENAAVEDARTCLWFEPKPAGECGWCGRDIAPPAFLWGRWVQGDEPVPACSDGCCGLLTELFSLDVPCVTPDEHARRQPRIKELADLRQEARSRVAAEAAQVAQHRGGTNPW